MLRIEALEAAYDQNQVLFGTALEVGRGEVVALMGRNGMGKTTTVHCVVGVLSPRLLILDEATEGLAPLIREEIWSCLQRLKDLGHSILLIDKNLDELAHLADRSYIMEKGRVVWQGATRELTANEQLRLTYLG